MFTARPHAKETPARPVFAVVFDDDETVTRELNAGKHLSNAIITVELYAPPDEYGDPPEKAVLIDVYNQVVRLARFITEDTTPGLAVPGTCYAAGGMRPQADERYGGLVAVARFTIALQRHA